MEHFKWIEIVTNPELYIDLEIGGHKIGIYFLVFIVFAEAGLFTGLIFSSDSFLFVAGIYSHLIINQLTTINNEAFGVLILAGLIATASIVGNTLAYAYGSKAEIYFNKKKDGFFFKRKYLEKSKIFFGKYGVWSIILAHYLPLVRVFIPILSAVSGMKFVRFITLISISSTIWSFSIILFGHYLYKFLLTNYDFNLKQHLWLIIFLLLIILVFYLIFRLIWKKFFLPKKSKSKY